MDREYFQKLLDAQPFVPFAIQLASGVVHTVRFPDRAMTTRSRIVIRDPDVDSIVVCPLDHVTKVVILSAAE